MGKLTTPAIGNLIYTANAPEVFKVMLEKAKHYFNDGMYNTAMEKIQFLIDRKKVNDIFQFRLNQHSEPNSFTGYKRPNKEKLANVLIAYITKCKSEFNDRLKLNKLLFYSDFLSYKLTGFSITGLSYRAIQYGPVPTYYDNIYAYLENEEIIFSNWIKGKDGSATENFYNTGKL
ncbi:MAG: SocA family protein [Chitinophagaceae bacterium]|nr:SocA family protein [Chitinophagaceae bacterium]